MGQNCSTCPVLALYPVHKHTRPMWCTVHLLVVRYASCPHAPVRMHTRSPSQAAVRSNDRYPTSRQPRSVQTRAAASHTVPKPCKHSASNGHKMLNFSDGMVQCIETPGLYNAEHAIPSHPTVKRTPPFIPAPGAARYAAAATLASSLCACGNNGAARQHPRGAVRCSRAPGPLSRIRATQP